MDPVLDAKVAVALYQAIKAEALSMAPGVHVTFGIRFAGEQSGCLLPAYKHAGATEHVIIVRTTAPYVTGEDGSENAQPEDAITLAHEMGHLSRRLQGIEDPEYVRRASVVHKNGYDELRPIAATVLVEEGAAWAYARDVLERHGFTDWVLFETTRDAALKSYRDGLTRSTPSQ